VNNKELILDEAMKLFAKRWYHSTSTKLIAKEVGVSESLIFRHYWNKEWLLKAIFEKWASEIRSYMDSVLSIEDTRDKVRAMIEFPLVMVKKNIHHRKLSFAIKFQHPDLYRKLRAEDIDILIMWNLKTWLEEIWVESVELEISNLIVFVEWIVQVSIKNPDYDLQPLIEQWKSKY